MGYDENDTLEDILDGILRRYDTLPPRDLWNESWYGRKKNVTCTAVKRGIRYVKWRSSRDRENTSLLYDRYSPAYCLYRPLSRHLNLFDCALSVPSTFACLGDHRSGNASSQISNTILPRAKYPKIPAAMTHHRIHVEA